MIKAVYCCDDASRPVQLCNMETSLKAVCIDGKWQEAVTMYKFPSAGCYEVSFLLKDHSRLPDYAFAFCNNLDKIELPDSLTTIGESAFSGCVSLSDVCLNGKIESVGENAFGGCLFTSFVIPSGVKTLEAWTFYECKALATLALPSSLEEVSWTAFSRCPMLTEIIYSGTKENWQRITEYPTDNHITVHCSDGDILQ